MAAHEHAAQTDVGNQRLTIAVAINIALNAAHVIDGTITPKITASSSASTLRAYRPHIPENHSDARPNTSRQSSLAIAPARRFDDEPFADELRQHRGGQRRLAGAGIVGEIIKRPVPSFSQRLKHEIAVTPLPRRVGAVR